MSEHFDSICAGGSVRIRLKRFDIAPKLTAQRLRKDGYGVGVGQQKTILGSLPMIQDMGEKLDAGQSLQNVVPEKLFSAIAGCKHACNGEHGGCQLHAELANRRTLFKRQV